MHTEKDSRERAARFDLGFENQERVWIEVREHDAGGRIKELQVLRGVGNIAHTLDAGLAAPWLEFYYRRRTALELFEAARELRTALSLLNTLGERILRSAEALNAFSLRTFILGRRGKRRIDAEFDD